MQPIVIKPIDVINVRKEIKKTLKTRFISKLKKRL